MQEQQDYISVGEVAKAIGIDRSTLYYHIKRLNIETKKFPFNRQAYLSRVDFERIKGLKEIAEKLEAQDKPSEETNKDWPIAA